jgi:hypothetical protein
MRDGGQERCLDLGGVVDPGRHAVRDQLHQEVLFAFGGILDQFDKI